MKPGASLSRVFGEMRADTAPFFVGQIRGVSLALHGTERRSPSPPPSTFQTVSLGSRVNRARKRAGANSSLGPMVLCETPSCGALLLGSCHRSRRGELGGVASRVCCCCGYGPALGDLAGGLEGEGDVARSIGGDALLADELFPFVARGVGEELDVVGLVGFAVELARYGGGGRTGLRRGEDGEVLQSVGTRVGVAEVVECATIDTEVYAKLAVGEDRVTKDARAGGATFDIDAVKEVGEGADAVGFGTDQVALDPNFLGVAADAQAVDVVAGDEVALGGRGAAYRAVGGVHLYPVTPVWQSGRARGVSADEVAHDPHVGRRVAQDVDALVGEAVDHEPLDHAAPAAGADFQSVRAPSRAPIELHHEPCVGALGQGVGGGSRLRRAIDAHLIGYGRKCAVARGANGYGLHPRTGDGEAYGVGPRGGVGLLYCGPQGALVAAREEVGVASRAGEGGIRGVRGGVDGEGRRGLGGDRGHRARDQ